MAARACILRRRHRIVSGGLIEEYGRLNGPFEYVSWITDAQFATPMAIWKGCQWANALGTDVEAVPVG